MRREHFGNDGDIWRVIPTGGIFRHKMIDEDAFTLITCHEVGHHIGGLPLKRSPLRGQFHWATTEGQADYFAASKCFRQYAEVTGGNEKFATKEFHIEDELLDEKVFERCQAIFSSREEAAICSRTIRAGIVLTRFMAHYRGMSPEKLNPHDEDPQVLERTHDGHPRPQCRLDTFVHGALCEKSHWTLMPSDSISEGSCSEINGHTVGNRPRCWFSPTSRYLPYEVDD